MRLDEDVLMDFFREHINVTVSIISARILFSYYYRFFFIQSWKLARVSCDSSNAENRLQFCACILLKCGYCGVFLSLNTRCPRKAYDVSVLLTWNWKVVFTLIQKVESRVRILADMRELASAESLDSFTLIYTNILEHQPDCPVICLPNKYIQLC